MAYFLIILNLMRANSTFSLIFKHVYSHFNHFNEAELEGFDPRTLLSCTYLIRSRISLQASPLIEFLPYF